VLESSLSSNEEGGMLKPAGCTENWGVRVAKGFSGLGSPPEV
jgi:hypothetical protein